MLSFSCICFFFDIAASDNLTNWKLEFLRELIITLIMGWNRHDCTSSIAHKNIIGDPYWNLLAVCGINGISTCKCTSFLFRKLCSLKVALRLNGLFVSFNLCFLRLCRNFIHKRMLWRKHCVSRTEQCIRTSRKDCERFVRTVNCKVHRSPF